MLDLRTDLAELYIKLKEFDKGKEILIEAMKYLKKVDEQEIDTKPKKVHYLLLLAKIFLEEDVQRGDYKFKQNLDALGALKEARNTQGEVIEKCREMNSDSIDKERIQLAEINYQLGKYLEEREANAASAIQVYSECVAKDETHVKAHLALASLHQA